MATSALTEVDVLRDEALLDADERQTLQRFKQAPDRPDYTAAHAILRRMLTALLLVPRPTSGGF